MDLFLETGVELADIRRTDTTSPITTHFIQSTKNIRKPTTNSDLFKEPALMFVFPSRGAVVWKERVMEMMK
jgi:hypothetical protein